MPILGVWDGHDAGAALVDVEGEILCAVNEERLTRRKLEVAFPSRSIEACLKHAGIGPEDVEEVALSTDDVAKTLTRWLPGLKESYYRRRRRTVRPGRLDPVRRAFKYTVTTWKGNGVSRRLSAAAVRRELARHGLERTKLVFVPHHMAHAAGAAFTSGFDSALVVTLDGVGDGWSGTLSRLEGTELSLLRSLPARSSLGIFFELVTQLLNMRELEDEGKVMALASYVHADESMPNPLLSLFEVEGTLLRARLGPLGMRRFLERELYMVPSERFAWMAQRTLEIVVTRWVRNALAATGARRIAYAGGVASNIRVNRALSQLPELDELFVFPHMGDGGLALGAAVSRAMARGARPPFVLGDLRLGPEISQGEIERALDASGLPYRRDVSIVEASARRLAEGQVLLWFQGRMEYGPRALGGRSILARPDRIELKKRLNSELKRRVWYQPFCPSLLDEEASGLLTCTRPDRYMTRAYQTTERGRARLSGVVAPDGTCRPQMVDARYGPYYRLLCELKKRIGVGAVLNTSFNLHGEPMVATPEQAIDTFVRSRADALVLGDFLVLPGGSSAPERDETRTLAVVPRDGESA